MTYIQITEIKIQDLERKVEIQRKTISDQDLEIKKLRNKLKKFRTSTLSEGYAKNIEVKGIEKEYFGYFGSE